MGKFFSSIMSTFHRFIVLLFFIFLKISYVNAATECIIANDFGNSHSITVPSNPIALKNDSGYQSDNEGDSTKQISTPQRAEWVDSKLFTSVGSGFYFEIQGSWTPWYGNFQTIIDNLGNKTTLLADQSEFCILGTLNPESPVIGNKGELDYITSSYVLNEKSDGYTKIFLNPETQKPCWLTAGEGLYIAFFGKTGYELPDLATHLKTAIVACDAPYATDKNGDGVITIDECYLDGKNKKNMAYYKPYRSEYLIGGIRCERDFFHGSDPNKIGINDCYDDVEQADGTTVRVNKTIFTFESPYLYKSKDKTKVANNERVKFIIYDRYYKDNVGEYIINIYSGLTDTEDEGIIKKILGDLEKVFVGSRNAAGNLVSTDAYGKEQTTILTQVYNSIVKDSTFALVCRTFIVLYMTFLGLQFAMGSLQYKTKELMTILLKLTFILGFTTATSWQVYDQFIVRFFLDGFSDIVVMIANITHKMFDPTVGNVASGESLASKFQFIDDSIGFFFSDAVTKKIQGLFFGVWFGFIVIPIFYILAIYYIFQLVNAIFPYIIMFIQAILALAIGPIFISFYLFKTTEHMFKNWLAFVGARFINMVFLFLFLFSFSSIIKQQFSNLLYFEVCKVPLLQAIKSNNLEDFNVVLNFFSLGIEVWDAIWSDSYPEPSFIWFCIDLLFIGVLIYLFGLIMKKVPNIIDSMIDIGGESGGGLRRGQSVFGGKQTFTEAIDSSIKLKGKWNGRGFGRDVGAFSKATGYLREQIGKYSGKAGNKLWRSTGKKAVNSIRDLYDSEKLMSDIMKNSDLKGLDAVDKATEEYRNKILSSGRYKVSEIDGKVREFEKNLKRQYIEKPIRDELSKIQNDLSKFSGLGIKLNSNAADMLIRDRMGAFFGREMATKPEQVGNYFGYLDGSSYFNIIKNRWNNDIKLSDSENIGLLRKFRMQEARSKLGLDGVGIKGYTEAMAEKLNENEKRLKKATIMTKDRYKSKKEQLLEEHSNVMNGQYGLIREEFSATLNEQTELLKRQEKLLSDLKAKQEEQEKENLDREAQRLKEISENEQIDQDIRERARLQMEKFNEENMKYRDLITASDDINKLLESRGFKETDIDLSNHLKDMNKINEISKQIDGEIASIVEQNEKIQEHLMQLELEAKDLSTISVTESGSYTVTNSNVNLAIEGLGEDFGIKGITSLGLGEDNKDLLGFGEGAAAAILGSHFETEDNAEYKEKEAIDTLNRTKLRIAKQEHKVLLFQLEQAKVSGDERAINELEQKVEESKNQVRILQDDVDSGD